MPDDATTPSAPDPAAKNSPPQPSAEGSLIDQSEAAIAAQNRRLQSSPTPQVSPPAPPAQEMTVNPSVSAPSSAASKKTAAPKMVPQKLGIKSAPTKIGKEDKKKNNGNFILGCFGGLLLLFILFLILMVFVMAKGGADSPVLKAFNVAPGDVKRFLLTFISAIFGFLAFIFLAIFLVGLFKISLAKKTDKLARNKAIKLTFVGFLPLAVFMLAWIGLYTFISQIEIAAERVIAEIIVVEPEEVKNLVAPVEVRFSAKNVATAIQNSDLSISKIDWDLDGDGVFETPATQPEITHIYKTIGNYRVGLRAIVQGEEQARLYTYLLIIPEAVFDAEPAKGTLPLIVQFDATHLLEKAIKVKSLDWDFEDDGKYELTGKDQIRPSFTFRGIGDYRVHLRLIDERDNVKNFYRTISVIEGSEPNISGIIDVKPGLLATAPANLRFDASASRSLKGNIIKYEWDFGDDSDLQSGKTVTHIYPLPGRYTVMLRVTDDLNQEAQETAEVDISSVSAIPVATIQTLPAPDAVTAMVTGEVPLAVSFDGSLSQDSDKDIVGYDWDFNDDSVADASGEKADYTFITPGLFKVTLKVTDSESQSHTAQIMVQVSEPKVKAALFADPVEGPLPLLVNFDGSSSSTFKGKIVSYTWDFDDGTPPATTGAKITHRFDKVGTYEVKLKVTTDQNESGESIQTIHVREVALRACFIMSRRTGKVPLSISFDSKCSTGTVAKYKWDFGDGTSSEARQTTHTFDVAGEYTVTLEVIDDKNNVNIFSDAVQVTTGGLQ